MGGGRSHGGGGIRGGASGGGKTDAQLVQEAVDITYAKFGTKEGKENLDRMWKDFRERYYGTLADNGEIDRYDDVPKGLLAGDTLETEASWYTLLYKDGSHVNVHEGELMVDGKTYPLSRLSLREKPVYIFNEEASGANDSLGFYHYDGGYGGSKTSYRDLDHMTDDRRGDYDGSMSSDYLDAITKRISTDSPSSQRHLKKERGSK